MPGRGWSRDETLVAFNIYCRTPFGRLHARNPEIIKTAIAMGRTPNALAMKCCNLAALDTALQARGIRGLTGTSRLDEQIWSEFEEDPEALSYEAEQAYASLLNSELRTSETVEWEDVQGLERAIVTRVRVNQHFFRSLVLAGYRSRCAVCDLPISSLLVAAHIVPWSVDRTLRMNPRNGICLCALHDRAFDKGLIWITAEYRISLAVEFDAISEHPAVGPNFARFNGQMLNLPDRWLPDPIYLQRHAALLGRG